MAAWQVLQRTLMITSFVFVMMIAVEYLNVLTRGSWQRALRRSRWSQYLVAALLGATPGCLGAFVVIALYTHRVITLGAVVTCMIATSGDEAFVMLALFPTKAALLTLGISGIGLVAGILTDLWHRGHATATDCGGLTFHEEESCECFVVDAIAGQLRHPSPARGLLVVGIGIFVLTVVAGQIGPPTWNWIRITIVGVGTSGLFIVLTVPEHFLEEHLWRHTALEHVPRIFLWTLGAMVVLYVLDRHVQVNTYIRDNPWGMLVVAGLLGVVPESGPHLIFVTLHSHGTVPLSTLVASSIVQDGHGMLPLFAHSWRDFLRVKSINLGAGLLVGSLLLVFGR